jgi:hypothetical protein
MEICRSVAAGDASDDETDMIHPQVRGLAGTAGISAVLVLELSACRAWHRGDRPGADRHRRAGLPDHSHFDDAAAADCVAPGVDPRSRGGRQAWLSCASKFVVEALVKKP